MWIIACLFLGKLYVPKIYKKTTDKKKPEPSGKNKHLLVYDCQSENISGYSLTINGLMLPSRNPTHCQGQRLLLYRKGSLC